MDSIKGKFEAVWQSLLTDMLKWVKVSPFMHYSPFSVRMWCHYPFSCFSISTPTALWPKPFPKEGQNRPFQSLTGGKSNPGKHRNEASIVWRKLLIHPDFTNRERAAVLMNLSFIWKHTNAWLYGPSQNCYKVTCHKVCVTLHSPLLFIGRTRTATFTLETLWLLSSMVPPDLLQMNEWTQV